MTFRIGDVLLVVAAEAPGGKTDLVRGLVMELRSLGFQPVALKPVETACPILENHDIGSRDGGLLHELSEGRVPLPVVAPYRLRATGNAPEAGRAVGLELRMADLVGTLAEAARYGDILVVEAAGPALEKLAEDGTPIDLAEQVRGTVVLGPSGLETESNQRILADAKSRGLSVLHRTPV